MHQKQPLVSREMRIPFILLITCFAAVHDLKRPPLIHAVNLAASDKSGLVPFVVTEHPMHSSLLTPISPAIRPLAITHVIARTLDEVLRDLGVPPSKVELMVLDTQGSEHKVLAGSKALLAHVSAVVVEMPGQTRYYGQATVPLIDSILSRNGLTRRRTNTAGCGPADGLYLRKPAETGRDTGFSAN